jgi:hypothetical protein
MGVVSTTLRHEAESIFTDLGYEVTSNGTDLRAERKWRVVDVTPVDEPDELPTSGQLRCFVTWERHIDDLEQRLSDSEYDYDWAIIGVTDEDYVVTHCPDSWR